MGWTINVGTTEFDRINSQYRRLVEQLKGENIRAVALEVLTTECRMKSKMGGIREENNCLSWPQQVVAVREKAVEKRFLEARERGKIKLVLFYTGFVIIFLLGPPFLIYLLIIGILKLKENIKIIR